MNDLTTFVFACSDKGGTGRTVTTCNLAYRCALQNKNVCYLDFDFGSPTAGAVLGLSVALLGTEVGLHSYFGGQTDVPGRIDIWDQSEFLKDGGRPARSGDFYLYPGDIGGFEFAAGSLNAELCARLFNSLIEDFDFIFVDLSAGRSNATRMVVEAFNNDTQAMENQRFLAQRKGLVQRWIIFHRWTKQHILAADGLIHGERGLIDVVRASNLDADAFDENLEFVRTAVLELDGDSANTTYRETQRVFLRTMNQRLDRLASEKNMGQANRLGSIPMEPMLQWREQLITDSDVDSEIANPETAVALRGIAFKLMNDESMLHTDAGGVPVAR